MGIETEGSAERAAHRGGNFFVELEGDGTLLNTPESVEALVRSFLGRVMDTRAAYWEGATPEASVAAIQAASKEYADIFMGKDKEYSASPWNSPGRLGAHMRASFGDAAPGVTDEGMAEAWFVALAARLIGEIAEPHEEDRITDDAASFQLDVLIEEAWHILLGLPMIDEDIDL